MIMGVLLARKRYSVAKYCCVLLIVLGVSLFLYKDKPIGAPGAGVGGPAAIFQVGFGELLLVSDRFYS